MPCIKCSNGKWKYGEHGNCQFDTLKSCRAAEAAIHARENPKKILEPQHTKSDCRCAGDCSCQDCKNKNQGAANGK